MMIMIALLMLACVWLLIFVAALYFLEKVAENG